MAMQWVDAPAEEMPIVDLAALLLPEMRATLPPETLGGIEDWFPAALTNTYTSSFFPLTMPSVDGDPRKQRIFYIRSLLVNKRQVDVVEYALVNGVWQAFCPHEFTDGDNRIEGQAVDCKLVWIQIGGWRYQMRVYGTAEQFTPKYTWVAKFAYPDPPIIFDFGAMIRNIMRG